MQWTEAQAEVEAKEAAWQHRVAGLQEQLQAERAQREVPAGPHPDLPRPPQHPGRILKALEVASEAANAVVLVAKMNQLMEEVENEKAARCEREQEASALRAQVSALTEQLRRVQGAPSSGRAP